MVVSLVVIAINLNDYVVTNHINYGSLIASFAAFFVGLFVSISLVNHETRLRIVKCQGIN